jgi:arylsulfatase A-like enzyme
MKRHTILILLTATLWSAIGASASSAERPNIIFILTDDQGYGDLGCFGARDIATPNIDKLCAQGMKFTSFYVTNRCSPTRLAFMTGSLPERAGWSKVIYRHSLVGIHPDEVTVAELMTKAGYTTGAVGKWHLGEFQEFNPVRHGFDFFYGFLQCGGAAGKDEGICGTVPQHGVRREIGGQDERPSTRPRLRQGGHRLHP